jgi:hypothetical protein
MSDQGQGERRGPNLVVIYTLIAIAFVAAIVLAGFIVAPFYLHRR